jgi:uncharacterized protein YbjQ (UPF0145 family)
MNNLLFFIALIAIGYVVGTLVEKRHYRSIHEREKKFLYLPAVTMKTVTHPDQKVTSAELVCGSAVISIDYFKRFLASLRNIFGGTVETSTIGRNANKRGVGCLEAMAYGTALTLEK